MSPEEVELQKEFTSKNVDKPKNGISFGGKVLIGLSGDSNNR